MLSVLSILTSQQEVGGSSKQYGPTVTYDRSVTFLFGAGLSTNGAWIIL